MSGFTECRRRHSPLSRATWSCCRDRCYWVCSAVHGATYFERVCSKSQEQQQEDQAEEEEEETQQKQQLLLHVFITHARPAVLAPVMKSVGADWLHSVLCTPTARGVSELLELIYLSPEAKLWLDLLVSRITPETLTAYLRRNPAESNNRISDSWARCRTLPPSPSPPSPSLVFSAEAVAVSGARPLRSSGERREKTAEELLDELETLNAEQPQREALASWDWLAELKRLEEHGKAMCLWTAAELTHWMISFRARCLLLSSTEGTESTEEKRAEVQAADRLALEEALAAVVQAVYLQRGQRPRLTQLLALSLFLKKATPDRAGRLLQVATGEGKSLIVAMLAIVQALVGGPGVDVITSSPVLAARDAQQEAPLFALCGLTVACNWKSPVAVAHVERQAKEISEPCYAADVVYGAMGDFQGDLFREEYLGQPTRGARPYRVLIVDEVDDPLIDGLAHRTQLNAMQPAMDHLLPLLVALWHRLVKKMTSTNPPPEVLQKMEEDLTCYAAQLLSGTAGEPTTPTLLYVPTYLRDFAKRRAPEWAHNAVRARYHMQLGRDYVITQAAELQITEEVRARAHRLIAPVDYRNTGMVNDRQVWGAGLHQFLQIKHGLRLSSEHISGCFISNLAYVKRYPKGRLFGLTGTLGEAATHEMLREVYQVDLWRVPTFRPRIFTELAPALYSTEEAWVRALCHRVCAKVDQGRATLVVCETIADVDQVETVLTRLAAEEVKKEERSSRRGTGPEPAEAALAGSSRLQVKRYARNDVPAEAANVEAPLQAGQVIVATNLACRGTDLGLSAANRCSILVKAVAKSRASESTASRALPIWESRSPRAQTPPP